MVNETTQAVASEWVSFPGGELEGQRPRVLCPACREALRTAAAQGGTRPGERRRAGGTLCFQCYRASLERERALARAGALDTGSEARFQEQLPFERLDEARLAMLKQERADTRGAVFNFTDRRRQAQMAARRALQSIVASRPTRGLASATYDRTIAAAMHAAELQLPESWLPFVVAR